MDLSKLSVSPEPQRMVVRHPVTNENTDIEIFLVGLDSPVAAAEVQRKTQERLNRGLSRGRVRVSVEELEHDQIALLVKCTKGWQNVELNGQPLSHSDANAATIYREYRWLREQVDEFLSERANFLGNSSPNS